MPTIKLNRHTFPLFLQICVKDIGIQHPTQDQRINDLSLWLELWVDLLDGWNVVLDDVVTNQYISILKDL
jgi:hypothetical protein